MHVENRREEIEKRYFGHWIVMALRGCDKSKRNFNTFTQKPRNQIKILT